VRKKNKISVRRKRLNTYKNKVKFPISPLYRKILPDWSEDNIMSFVQQYLINNPMGHYEFKTMILKITGFIGDKNPLSVIHKMGRDEVIKKINLFT
jgi:hypothetical protein